MTDTYEYDAWGSLVAQTGTTSNTRLYVGEEFDPDLRLINLRARYYDPGRGRFLTIDTVLGKRRQPLSFHRYLYAQDDPIGLVDPTGKEGLELAGILGFSTRTIAIASATYLLGVRAVTGYAYEHNPVTNSDAKILNQTSGFWLDATLVDLALPIPAIAMTGSLAVTACAFSLINWEDNGNSPTVKDPSKDPIPFACLRHNPLP